MDSVFFISSFCSFPSIFPTQFSLFCVCSVDFVASPPLCLEFLFLFSIVSRIHLYLSRRIFVLKVAPFPIFILRFFPFSIPFSLRNVSSCQLYLMYIFVPQNIFCSSSLFEAFEKSISFSPLDRIFFFISSIEVSCWNTSLSCADFKLSSIFDPSQV